LHLILEIKNIIKGKYNNEAFISCYKKEKSKARFLGKILLACSPVIPEKRLCVKDEIEVDKKGNEKIVHKLIEKIEPIEIPTIRDSNTTLVTDRSNNEKIESHRLIDNRGNIVDENDIEIMTKKLIDEYGVE
jgi:hypothetical protein